MILASQLIVSRDREIGELIYREIEKKNKDV